MRFRPKISLHGSGEVVELSNGSHADFTLMQGASGLGMRPREITTVALPSGGSLVQHRKGLEAEVQIPVLLGGSERKRWDLRRKLERLVRDEVEIRVTRPNGVYRSRFGFYKAGLEGEYGAGEDSPNGQKLVLEFTCPEGMWKGEQQDPEFRLAGIRKRFLSERAEPVPTGRRNLWRGSKLSVDRSNISISGNYEAEQVEDGLRITGKADPGTGAFSLTWTPTGGMINDLPHSGTLSLTVPLRNDGDMPVPVRVAMWTRDKDGKTLTTGVDYGHVMNPGEVYLAKVEAQELTEDSFDARYSMYYGANTDRPQIGAVFTVLDGITLVQDDVAAEPINGDAPFWGWVGKPGDSESVEFEKSSTYQSPFFPMILASSAVQGEIDLDIGGDAPVYPTWVIDGPGSDLIIENDKGDSLKVLTEFEDQVTITTDQLRQDITSPSMPDGELWEYVPTDSKFFALEPGKNKLKVSMVGAKPNSLVRCLYRENYLAGW